MDIFFQERIKAITLTLFKVSGNAVGMEHFYFTLCVFSAVRQREVFTAQCELCEGKTYTSLQDATKILILVCFFRIRKMADYRGNKNRDRKT